MEGADLQNFINYTSHYQGGGGQGGTRFKGKGVKGKGVKGKGVKGKGVESNDLPPALEVNYA